VKVWVPKDIGEMSQLADRFKEDRRANVVSLTNPNLRGYPKNDRKGEDTITHIHTPWCALWRTIYTYMTLDPTFVAFHVIVVVPLSL
jgi:hypothetical protein